MSNYYVGQGKKITQTADKLTYASLSAVSLYMVPLKTVIFKKQEYRYFFLLSDRFPKTDVLVFCTVGAAGFDEDEYADADEVSSEAEAVLPTYLF